MKILIIHHAFLEDDDPGGSRFNEMTKIWASLGHTITVIAGMVHYNGHEKRQEYKGKYFVRKKQGDVNVLRCHVSESFNKNFIGRLWAYFSFMFSAIWAGIFKVRGEFDVILVTSPPLFVGISAFLISKVKQVPYIFEVRDLWPESAIDTGVLKNKPLIKLSFWVERLMYNNAKLINVLTPAFRDHLILKKNIDPDKIIMIPNAADFSISDSLLKEFNREMFRKELGWQDKFIVLYVGAHGVANGLHQILDVCEKMQETNLLFVLIGDGMTKKDLISKAQIQKLSNIVFLNSVPKSEVFKYIISADLGASILSKNDTFKTVYSNKTFDYMSCKKPILMAIDGVSRKLVEESNSGTYVEPENCTDYINVIKMYMNNKPLLEEQGLNGYLYAKRNFDRQELAVKYINSIESNFC